MKAEEEQLKRFELDAAQGTDSHTPLEGTERPSFLIDKSPSDSAIGASLLPPPSLSIIYLNLFMNLPFIDKLNLKILIFNHFWRGRGTEVVLPFSSDLALREQYINFYGNLRMGKILEDLDACAGTIPPDDHVRVRVRWCVCGGA
jgi:hypothetical protein